jgi:hypothetical protein
VALANEQPVVHRTYKADQDDSANDLRNPELWIGEA